MNRLTKAKRKLILTMLVEGMSIRACARTSSVSTTTIMKLLKDCGRFCAIYQDVLLQDITCEELEVDEIWSFVYAKSQNYHKIKHKDKAIGDVWTWVALCPETRLVPSFVVGDRTEKTARIFITDLKKRITSRFQLTSDGHPAYQEIVKEIFEDTIDYAILSKTFKPKRVYLRKKKIIGSPNRDRVSTSMVERQNFNMRMSMRRFTRKSNGFSRKIENHFYAVALHFWYYNFCRIHTSIKTTPAVKAGVAKEKLGIDWLIHHVEAVQPEPKRPLRYAS